MTDEQKIEALQRILQGANVAQVNLGDGYQTFNLDKDGRWQQEPSSNVELVDAEEVDDGFCLAERDSIFNTRILTSENHYRMIHDAIRRFIKQDGVTSDVEQINPSLQNEWYYVMKGIGESGMASSRMGDKKFAEQMIAWFPECFADKVDKDQKAFVRNFAKSISAERNSYWTEGSEHKEVTIVNIHAHAKSFRIDSGKAKRAFLISNGLKKALEELKTEIQKAQNAR